MTKRELAVLVAIVAAFALLVGRALDYDFVWDDVAEIEQNPAFDAPLLDGLGSTQTERTAPSLTRLSSIELAYDSYRPLTFTSLWLDVHLFGRSPRALHRTNFLLGLLSILAVYVLARRLLGGPIALIPTAIFALHPVQIEAVAYVSGRADVLAGLFVILAAIAALRAIEPERRRAPWIAIACAAFVLSLCAKEAYVGFPLAFAIVLWHQKTLRKHWWIATVFGALSIAFLVARSAIVTSTKGGAITDALVALPAVWGQYIKIVVVPFDLSTERLRDPNAIWITAALALLVVLTSRRLTSPARNMLAGLGWFAALVGPAAIPIASNGVAADRYAYAALVGVAIALVGVGQAIHARWPRRALLAVPAIWGLLCVVVGWAQVPVWRSNDSLYTHAVTMTPESSNAQYRLGFLDAQAERWPEAIERFRLAIDRDPNNILALNNLGVAYLRTGQLADAEVALARAVEVAPAHFRAWLNLGLARIALGKRERGCADIARALEINPYYEAAQQRRCR